MGMNGDYSNGSMMVGGLFFEFGSLISRLGLYRDTMFGCCSFSVLLITDEVGRWELLGTVFCFTYYVVH